jgi:hypothetical protein
MKLKTEECDVCTLVLPAEDVNILRSPCGRYEIAECDLCRQGVGLTEFYPVNPNR